MSPSRLLLIAAAMSLFTLCCFNAFAQADTTFYNKDEAIIKTNDNKYDKIKCYKETILKRSGSIWRPLADTTFSLLNNDILRTGTYYYYDHSLSIVIDTFYSGKLDDGSVFYLSSVINIGKLSFTQSFIDANRVKAITVYSTDGAKTITHYTTGLMINTHAPIDFMGISMQLDDSAFIRSINLTSTFLENTKIDMGKIKPMKIFLSKNKPPVISVIGDDGIAEVLVAK